MSQWGAPSFGCMPKVSVVSSPEKGTNSNEKQENVAKTTQQTAGEQKAMALENKQNSRAEKECDDSGHLLVAQDRMYPALRSKSLNANPRKAKGKGGGSQEKPLTACSVKDLVAAFGSPGDKQTTSFKGNL